jgi:hypothetical protein
MASEAFNSLGGYTVGIPAVPVVSNTGTIVANVNNDYVLANTVLTNNLRYSNGAKYVPGSNTQLIFNNSNSFGSSANLTFDSTTNFLTTVNLTVSGAASLGDVANVSILGGLNGYFLQTDGLGTLTWAAGGNGGGGNGSPGGSNTQVQFNNAGSFGGDPGFTYDYNSNVLSVYQVQSNVVGNLTGTASNANVARNVTSSSQPNITSLGTLLNLDVTGEVMAGTFAGDGGALSNLTAANLVGSVPLAAQVSNNAQPNITSVGSLTSLTVIGNTTSGNLNSSNRIGGGNLFLTGNASVTGTVRITTGALIANGDVQFNGSNIQLGDVEQLHIDGGFNGQVLSTDGSGTLTWIDNGGGGGGNGTPGGSNTAIQFNDNGSFGGSPYLSFNKISHAVTVSGNLIANTFQMGAGIYRFYTNIVFFATTTSTTANQVLWSIPVSEISGVDFTIISTTEAENTRQTSKISSAYYSGVVAYNEFASLQINGGIGTFEVTYNAGNIMLPPSLQLLVSPDSASLTKYNMMITQYAANSGA